MENQKSNVWVGVVFVVIAVGALFLWGGRQTEGSPATGSSQAGSASTGVSAIRADEAQFAFGTISMRDGKVTHAFKVRNGGESSVRITKMYTSCMCTTAQMTAAGARVGPFGMPGHGIVPRIDVTLAPQEEAVVEAVFDPAAHGPAGIGKIERAVYLETDDGMPVALTFSASVTP